MLNEVLCLCVATSIWPFGNVATSLFCSQQCTKHSGTLGKWTNVSLLCSFFGILTKHRSSSSSSPLLSWVPHLSLNISSFGRRHWELKLGLAITSLLMGDIWQIFTVAVYQAGTFCADVPSAKLLALPEPYAGFLGWLRGFYVLFSLLHEAHLSW